MLIETWQLLRALERSGISRARKHKRIQSPGQSFPCLRVRLDKNFSVSSVEDVSDNDWPSWTVMEGNQSSFPVVRVQEPLMRISRGDKTWTRLGYGEKGNRRSPAGDEARLNVLEGLIGTKEISLSDKTKKLWKRLREQKAKELAECSINDSSKMNAIALLAERFSEAAKEPQTFLMKVAEHAVSKLSQGKLKAIDAVEQLMVGKGPPDESGDIPMVVVQLAFDNEETDNGYPLLYSQTVKNRLIESLPQDPLRRVGSDKRKKTEPTGVDALTGEADILEEKSFPKVNLPVPSTKSTQKKIGRKPFPLASMFSEAHCNNRYGMTNAKVFPLAKARATHLKEALEEITDDNRREKTWQHVASGRFKTYKGRKIETPDLLITYLEEKPMIDLKTAGFFGQSQSIVEAKFEVDAATVCEAFRGIESEKPNSRLNLFLIREASKGQAQVVMAESLKVKKVLDAAGLWQKAGSNNVPQVTMYLPQIIRNGQTITSVEDARPSAPYPDQVVRLLSQQWVRDGSSAKGTNGKQQKNKQEIVGPGLVEVLSLMFRMEGKWEATLKNMISLLIRRVDPLLIGIFGAKHAYGPRYAQGKHEPFFDYPRESREIALRAVGVLGILLDSFNIRKEKYMNDPAYQIGQVLSLADTLHKDYCIVVRKGELPNSLIGTSLMRRALDDPSGALADLCERMMEYVRWAKVANEPQNLPEDDPKRIAIREARKKLRQYQPLADHLGTANLPSECDDVMKAQLLLGFLASQPDDEQIKKGKESNQ